MPSGEAATLSADGRYAIFGQIAAGGMATLHIGRLIGAAGFARTVAIKRLRPKLTSNNQFVAMFIDEARIAARIRHPNVAATIDVFRQDQELCLVLEYVHGESLRHLLTSAKSAALPPEPRIIGSVLCGALHGLHSAHEAKNEKGDPLGIVHRDVSPQNILVGQDGIARVVDFGIAKAAGRLHTTAAGQMKGKWFYMAPEQLSFYVSPGGHETEPDRRTDVFAAGIVAWEALTGERLFRAHDELQVMKAVLERPIPRLRDFAPSVPEQVERVVLRALERDPKKRFATARDFALELEDALPTGIASPRVVGDWVDKLVGAELASRERYLRQIEQALPGDFEHARASLPSNAPPAKRVEPRPAEGPAPASTSQVTASALARQRALVEDLTEQGTRKMAPVKTELMPSIANPDSGETTDVVTLTMHKPASASKAQSTKPETAKAEAPADAPRSIEPARQPSRATSGADLAEAPTRQIQAAPRRGRRPLWLYLVLVAIGFAAVLIALLVGRGT